MKDIALEKRHVRQTTQYPVTMASGIGCLLTLLFGAWIVPWMVAVGQWALHHLPWWYQAGTFPSLVKFLATPNLILGLIWLLYYLLTYLWAITTLSPRQKEKLRAQVAREDCATQNGWSFNTWPTSDTTGSSYQPPQSEKQAYPLSHVWPGELKHQLVEHCYQEYRKALTRYDPPPVDLKTPFTFCYSKGGRLAWEGSTLVLPEEMLTPERIHELLPFLAHSLYDYNNEDSTEEDWRDFPDYVPLSWLLFITGNFLWLPVAYRHRTDVHQEMEAAAQPWRQVRLRDEFAVLLGQGPALEHQLRRGEEELKQRGEIDRNVPTIVERIGHLEVLNERERQKMRALGLTPKEPPLVIDSPFRQIEKGNGKK